MDSKPKLVTICPANDAVALELSSWAEAFRSPTLWPEIFKKFDPIAVRDGAATREAVERSLVTAACVLFFGHGSYTELLGASGPLIDTANIGLAKGAIVVAVACSSGYVLGPDAVHRGVVAYSGFRDRFMFLSRDPNQDFFAATINWISSLVLYGATVEASVQKMIEDLTKIRDYYKDGEGRTSPNRTLGMLVAHWDLTNLIYLGDGSATL